MKANETCHEFVERIWGRTVTEEEMTGLLWHCTAFPCISPEELEKQLIKAKEDSGADYNLAMEQAEKAIQEAMGEPK